MASLFAIAATLLAACPTAIGAGMGASVERFSTNYAADDGFKQDFWNLFAPANSADGRSDAMAPSSAAKVYSQVLDFDSRDYPEQTNIFRGVVNVDECAAGTYKFEMTTSSTAHIFVDGEMLTGIHQTGTPQTKFATIEFKPGQDYSLEVWWGNPAGDSEFRLRYARQPEQSPSRAALTTVAADGSAADATTQLKDDNWQTDLSHILTDQGSPAITRCDYDGVYEDLKWFQQKPSSKFFPKGCGGVAGGSFSMTPDAANKASSMSFVQVVTISPRVDGTHAFFLELRGGNQKAAVYVQRKREQKQDPLAQLELTSSEEKQQKRGDVVLKVGEEYVVALYYGNDMPQDKTGDVRLLWEDRLLSAPVEDFTPITV